MASNTTTRASETMVPVAGIVMDSATGATLPGAHVRYLDADGMAHGAATDADGAYAFSAPGNATLIASFVGYGTQEVQVGEGGLFNFALQPGVDIEVVDIYGDEPKAAPAAIMFGLLATMLALASSDKSNGRL